jgi:hypothetical protein
MSFDPFRPDDVGDYTASYTARHGKGPGRRLVARLLVAVGALALLGAAAVTAVAVT